MKVSCRDWLRLKAMLCTLGAVTATFNIDSLISKADIFYQRLSMLGFPNELRLKEVKELPYKKDLKVIIHGFTGSRSHVSIKAVGNAYLAQGRANVLLADWSDAASLDYYSSRNVVGKVAKVFGKLLEDFMIRFEIDPNDIHIIGHSLGAHIAGGIGEYFNGNLGRVTGLDPALPLFTPTATDSLHSTAAQFVDVIHTDYPVFGDITPRGTVDFYPDYGHATQKGCDDFDILSASKLIFEAYSCSHNRAVLLYAESIGQSKNFPALTCNINAIKQRNSEACHENISDETTRGETISKSDDVVYMGENVTRSAFGIYYLDTYGVPPFGMGLNSEF